ncbi:DPBB and LysM peptidoglycan-binding domain-containing protein [Mucilaginibacter arboris]|uniref:LysM peptidoglycan-binding domain-containing protein n=1 Tax=Mucilaginibacter arboris TaxID=2682090 RepID=A0A7K1SWW4_9SPHI|nr:LysM peptidoglycan-binding domain-containing protein [Mucilaginibacter arboris]MVN21727.1 LysM peptidoglycan-binding domain-containing protein [Mucilaginibacter arboris]
MLKIKYLATVLSFFSLCNPLFAHPLADSVGIENQNGKMIILHKLDPKDNYYSIARRYNVRPKAVMDYNNNAKMQIGAIIKVPTERAFVSNSSPVKTASPVNPSYTKTTTTEVTTTAAAVNTNADQPEYTQYKVSAGETLYAISRRFQVKVDDIINWNSLKSNNLNAGQILRIKREEPQPAAAPVITAPAETVMTEPKDRTLKRDSTRVTTASDSSSGNRRLPNNRYGLTEKNEKGTAVWINDPNLDPKKKYVLHRTAPVGTIIKITNPMTNKTTFAKVVGSFTENETNKDAIVVMTKDVAESLGALDKRFYVNLSYGSPNTNEQ